MMIKVVIDGQTYQVDVEDIHARPVIRLRANNGEALAAAAVAGHGITTGPSFILAGYLESSTGLPTVDVQVQGGAILADDLTFRAFAGYLTAPAVDLILEVTLADDNAAVVQAYEAPLSALDGAGAVAFAAGVNLFSIDVSDPSLPTLLDRTTWSEGFYWYAYDLQVVGAPTVREPDGLALSSRNVYLSAEQREQALFAR